MGCDKRHLKTLELFKTGFNALADGWGNVDDFTGHFDFHTWPPSGRLACVFTLRLPMWSDENVMCVTKYPLGDPAIPKL
jgi:hypothetical protein